MPDPDKAARLRADADADDRRADEINERGEDWLSALADYLRRRADWRRQLARDEERE